MTGMEINVTFAGPPHRTEPVAEFHVLHDGVQHVPAEVYRADGTLMIALNCGSEGVAWEYPVAAFMSAIERGAAMLGSSSPGSA